MLRYRLEYDGQAIELTFQEWKVLCYFVAHLGREIAREELWREVWG